MKNNYSFIKAFEDYLIKNAKEDIWVYSRKTYYGSLLIKNEGDKKTTIIKPTDSTLPIGAVRVRKFVSSTRKFKGKNINNYIYVGNVFKKNAIQLAKTDEKITIILISTGNKELKVSGAIHLGLNILNHLVEFANSNDFSITHDFEGLLKQQGFNRVSKAKHKRYVEAANEYLAFSAIKELNIIKFRHLTDLNIPFGKYITAIAGQNGIGKSSILGLVGHVCKEKNGHKTIDNRDFATEYSEIFKFSYPKYDKPGEHEYLLKFTDGGEIPVKSYVRKETGRTESLRLRVGKSSIGGGKIDCPVIYLGLKRLFPLAQEDVIAQKKGNLNAEEVKFYQDSHNLILLMNEIVTPEEVSTQNKSFYGVATSRYDSIGNSAGQDNIGQIITAIISFQRLKKKLGDKYKGGILIIDEVDVTMYPAAQLKLIEFLFKNSAKLNLQVIFTTHSVQVLNQLLTSHYKYNSTVCYLQKARGSVRVEVAKEEDLPRIVSDLNVTPLVISKSTKKVDAYLEDKEAEFFLKAIISKENRERIKFIDLESGIGGDELIHLVNKKIPSFINSLIVLDGDKQASGKNIVSLPGGDSPEKLIFNFLKSKDETDAFWDDFGGYTKQVCFRDRQSIGNRDEMKDWFKKQLPYWGKGGAKLFKQWSLGKATLIKEFNKGLAKAIEKLLV